MTHPHTGDDAPGGVPNPFDGTLSLDFRLRCTAFDAGAASLFPSDRSAIIGAPVLADLCAAPTTARRAVAAALDVGRPQSFVCKLRANDRHVDGWAVPERDGVTLFFVVAPQRTSVRETDVGHDRTDALLSHAEALADTGGWEYDVTTETLYWTDGTRRIHDVDDEYVPTVDAALSFYHPDDRETMETAVTRALSHGESYDVESRIRTATGRTRWVRTVGVPIETDGTVTAIRGAIRDITAEKKRMRDIELLERAIDSAPIGVSITDVRLEDNPLVYVNEAFERLTGYTEADALGSNCRFLQGPETDPESVAALRAAIESNEATTTELRNYRKDGTMFWNRLTIAPVRDDDGRVTHYIGFQTDVTAQKEAEQRLRQFERAVESAGHAIYMTDVEGTIEYVNGSFETLTGYDSAEALGETPRLLNSGEMPDEYFERLWNTVLAGETFEERIIDQDKSGRRYHAQQTIAPITSDDGDVTGFVAVQTDITNRIEREQQVAVLDRVLRHNLRNDMNLILGHAERLCSEATGDLADSAETIHETGARLVELVEKERDMMQLLADDPAIQRLDVGTQISQAIDRIRQRFPDADVSAADVDDLAVNATSQLDDALAELLENAIVHTDHDDPTAEVSVEATDDTVVITVADTGPGLEAFEHELITATELPDALYHGDGIGLWLVNWVVTRSGGAVRFDDRDPRGTVVRVRLPRAHDSRDRP